MSNQLEEQIRRERPQPSLLVLTINRPRRRNAFDGATARAMERAIDDYDNDPQLRCAIITGAGDTFCAGQDLTALTEGDIASTQRRGGFGVLARPPRKPVIAAVEGHAVGGGLELCLACDLIVASNTARMGLPEVTHSLTATGGGLFRLPRRLPYHIAMELVLTGRMADAAELHRHGLINRLTEPGTALAEAIALSTEILRGGPLAVVAAKTVVRAAQDWSEDESWRRQDDIVEPALTSHDATEGLRAFAEKRPPVWTGR